MALSDQKELEPSSLFSEIDKSQLDRFARIEIIERIEGFYPTSKPEQVKVMQLEPFLSRKTGAAKYLSEVITHGRKLHQDDPVRAPRKIVKDFVDWAVDSSDALQQMRQVQEELEFVNPTLTANVWFDTAEHDPRPGMLKFLRFFDLDALNKGRSVETVGYDPQNVDYNPKNSGIMHYLDMANNRWNVQSIKLALPSAISHEENRLRFWGERLIEVVDHSPRQLSAIAHEGLDKLAQKQQSV